MTIYVLIYLDCFELIRALGLLMKYKGIQIINGKKFAIIRPNNSLQDND